MRAAEYLASVVECLGRIDPAPIDRIAERLFEAYRSGRRVLVFGNGASAALASHLATDLAKGTATDLGLGPQALARPRLKVVSLSDNAALLTALGNDLSYDDVFLEQLKCLLEPGDVVLGISGSGASPSVLRALAYARSLGAVTLGLTGARASGEQLAGLCDECLRAPSEIMETIEDLHVIAHHAIVLALRDRIRADQRGLR